MKSPTIKLRSLVTGFRRLRWRAIAPALALSLVVALLVVSCGGDDNEPAATAESTDEHMHGDDHTHGDEHDEHMMADHMIPEEAASMVNPIEATTDSVETGKALFATHCTACHGETGAGDGPSAAGLDPKPANLSEDHVQDLSDGGLFHIITHGRSGTAMPAWEGTLSEDERWHVVNYLRTFKE